MKVSEHIAGTEKMIRREMRRTRRTMIVSVLLSVLFLRAAFFFALDSEDGSPANTAISMPEQRARATFKMRTTWEYDAKCHKIYDDPQWDEPTAKVTIKPGEWHTVPFRTSSRDVDVVGGMKMPDIYYSMHLLEDELEKINYSSKKLYPNERIVCRAEIPDMTFEIYDEGSITRREYLGIEELDLAVCEVVYEPSDGTRRFVCQSRDGWDKQLDLTRSFIDQFVDHTYGERS